MRGYASIMKQRPQDSNSIVIRSIGSMCLALFLGLLVTIVSPREASAIPVNMANVGCPFCVEGTFNLDYNGTIFGFSGAQSLVTSNATGFAALDGNISYTNSLVCCSFPIDTGLLGNLEGTVRGHLFASISTLSTDTFSIFISDSRFSVGASPPVFRSQSFRTQPISASVPEPNTIGLLSIGLFLIIYYRWQHRRHERKAPHI